MTREEVGLELQLQPRAGSKQGPIIFHIYLRPVGKRWLVDSFMPVATLAPLDAEALEGALGPGLLAAERRAVSRSAAAARTG